MDSCWSGDTTTAGNKKAPVEPGAERLINIEKNSGTRAATPKTKHEKILRRSETGFNCLHPVVEDLYFDTERRHTLFDERSRSCAV